MDIDRLREAAREVRSGARFVVTVDGIPGTDRGPEEVSVSWCGDEYYVHVRYWHNWSAPERSVGLGWRWDTQEIEDYSTPVLADALAWAEEVT